MSNLPDKEFNVMVISILTKPGKRMEERSESPWHPLILLHHSFHLTSMSAAGLLQDSSLNLPFPLGC